MSQIGRPPSLRYIRTAVPYHGAESTIVDQRVQDDFEFKSTDVAAPRIRNERPLASSLSLIPSYRGPRTTSLESKASERKVI